MTTPAFQGSIFVLTLYDVCEEINLSELRKLIPGKTLAPTFKHTAPEYVRFERPPVIEPLDPVALQPDQRFDATLQYYDYGVVSVLLRLSYTGTWENLEQLAGRWISSTVFDELSGRLLRQKVESIRPALVKYREQWLSEDYYIFHLQTGSEPATRLLAERGGEISQLVSGETATLSDLERAEVLQGALSFYQNDLIVVGWNTAFVYDTDAGAESSIRLLEYANSQLLQYRHYDDFLTRELDSVYRYLDRRVGLFSLWRLRSAADRFHTVLLDVIELTERTNNALKFVGDMFAARLYKLSVAKIGVTEYELLVQEKLRTADKLYDFMIDQFNHARGFVLEAMVVIILVIELVFLFRGK